jgi:PPOX class probable F420-dependent enzyme
MAKLSDKARTILQKKTFAHLATLMPDGTPHVSPVWVDIDGDIVVVNSARGRVKDENVQRNRHVALSATDPDNPYSSITLRGQITQITSDGADAHIDAMAKKYLGQDKYPFRQPGEQRVIYRIAVEKQGAM